jgi:large subunit ribosomal protein L7/L12
MHAQPGRRWMFAVLVFAGFFVGGTLVATPVSAQDYQKGEQILAADKAPADAPLRRQEKGVWYQLSNLRKGGSGQGIPRPGAEFSFDYARTDGDQNMMWGVTLIARGPEGRKEYSSWGPFSPFGDKSGTVTAESSFSPFAKRLGDNFEIWLETSVSFEGKTYRFKVSNTVTLGSVGQTTLARHWTPDEVKGLDRWQKSITPPGAAPSGHTLLDPQLKVVNGTPCKAGWIGEWQPAEIIDVRKDGMLLIKYDGSISQFMVPRPRNWVSVETKVLGDIKSGGAKFTPSVSVLPNGMAPLEEGLVPVTSAMKLVPGMPLKMEWANKWSPVTVVKVLGGDKVRIHWDDWKGHPDEEKSRDVLAIDKETLEELQSGSAEEKFAERAEKMQETAESSFEGKSGFGRPSRRKQDYPIRIAIPKNAVKVTEDMPIEEGTKLGCSWGSSWHDVTVLEVNDDGTLYIHWDKYDNDVWDADSPRDQLIIDKKVLAKLQAKSGTKTTAGTKSTSKPAAGKDKSETSESTSSAGGYEVVLRSYGKQKFPVMKAVMSITGLEIKDAKELVENTPITLKQGLSKDEAEKVRKKINEAGGVAVVEESKE